jgi:hypothetical protein
VTNCHARSWPRSCTVVNMSQQERQRVTMTGGADAPPLDARLARLIRDFPDWDIAYQKVGVWCAERKSSPTSLELHCARNLGELRGKLKQAGQ